MARCTVLSGCRDRQYPGGLPTIDEYELVGDLPTVQVATPRSFGLSTVTVVGSGDIFLVEGTAEYPRIGTQYIVAILKLSGGRVIEHTGYFAAPFDPPAWRRPFVET